MFSTGFNSKCKSCVREEVGKKPKVKYVTRVELEEENRRLKEELKYYKEKTDFLNKVIIKYQEES